MTLFSRREFLATTSPLFAGSVFFGRVARAQSGGALVTPQLLPASIAHSPWPATRWLPERIAPADLHALAAIALDAAQRAGAPYSDVRISEHHGLHIVGDPGDAAVPLQVTVMARFTYGIRICVRGAWAFVHGNAPSADALVDAVHAGVATARSYAAWSVTDGPLDEFAAAPIVTGEWTTPIQLDPFTVPLGDQAALLSACLTAAARVRNAGMDFPIFHWMREARAFASSEGSRTTQTLYRLAPEIITRAELPWMEGVKIPVLHAVSGGYECVTPPDLQDTIKTAAEDAARLIWLPQRSLDVGRYPVVFDGATMGSALARTIGRALESDRALGEEVATSGLSYLNPPDTIVGTMIASPMLSVTANRELPSITAVHWDDEGVRPQEFPVITQGRLRQYFTSRRTAAAVRPGSATEPVQSTGCAVAPNADDPVLVRAPHLTVTPNTARTSLDDLSRDIPHGILVRDAQYVLVDGTLGSGVLQRGTMLEIRNGQPVSRLVGNALQFSTSRLWSALVALGDTTTVRTSVVNTAKGQPDTTAQHSVSAPAGRFKEMNVLNTRSRV